VSNINNSLERCRDCCERMFGFHNKNDLDSVVLKSVRPRTPFGNRKDFVDHEFSRVLALLWPYHPHLFPCSTNTTK